MKSFAIQLKLLLDTAFDKKFTTDSESRWRGLFFIIIILLLLFLI